MILQVQTDQGQAGWQVKHAWLSCCSVGADLGLLMQLLLEGVPAGHSLPMLRIEGLQSSKARQII